jgi:hypothetical protein
MRILHLAATGRSSRNKGTTGYEPKHLYIGSTCNYPCGYFAVTIFNCIIALILMWDISSLHFPALASKMIQDWCDPVFTHFVSSRHSSIPTKIQNSIWYLLNVLIQHWCCVISLTDIVMITIRNLNNYVHFHIIPTTIGTKSLQVSLYIPQTFWSFKSCVRA